MQASQASFPLQKWVQQSAILHSALLILIGTAILAASAFIEVPTKPVPITMQTFALVLIGAFYGSRLAFATVCAYLLEGALGLPVFSGGEGGAHHLLGPTGGYLAAFPFAAAFVGWCLERGWFQNFYAIFGVMILGHAIVFIGGVAQLATMIGIEPAIAGGFTPFILGTLVKCLLAAAVVQLTLFRK